MKDSHEMAPDSDSDPAFPQSRHRQEERNDGSWGGFAVTGDPSSITVPSIALATRLACFKRLFSVG
jgi:hypothetical protein